MRYFIITLFIANFMSNVAVAQKAADDYYDPEEMQAAREALKKGTSNQWHYLFLADRLEYQVADGGSGQFDIQGWLGGDIRRLWFKTEGEYSFSDNQFEEADFELLYSHAISPYFDFQAGFGQGLEKGPSTTYGSIGFQGLAPQWFEIDAALSISSEGDLSVNFEAEYELLLTQKLILQPRFETQFSFQDIPDHELGSGLTHATLGLRLRYEIDRKFAPYVGLSWSQKFGRTGEITKANGREESNLSFLVGLRAWF